MTSLVIAMSWHRRRIRRAIRRRRMAFVEPITVAAAHA
jgi:hypothetical protein